MGRKCIDFNGDLDLAKFNAKNAKALYPSSATLLQNVFDNAPDRLLCNDLSLSTFDTELQSKRKILTAFEMSLISAIAEAQKILTKKTTITCVKGKLIKKVTAINPKCPSGYKKK